MKTINDIFKLGTTDPTVHACLAFHYRGKMSIEDALINMVVTLVEQKRNVEDAYIKHMEICTTPQFRP